MIILSRTSGVDSGHFSLLFFSSRILNIERKSFSQNAEIRLFSTRCLTELALKTMLARVKIFLRFFLPEWPKMAEVTKVAKKNNKSKNAKKPQKSQKQPKKAKKPKMPRVANCRDCQVCRDCQACRNCRDYRD